VLCEVVEATIGTGGMKHPQSHLAELTLAVVFIGLYAGLALRTWGDFYFVQGLLLISGILLYPGYLLVVIMMRERREGGSS
jgi:hypothetical protein